MPFWTLWGNETHGLAVGIRLEVWASVTSVNFDGESGPTKGNCSLDSLLDLDAEADRSRHLNFEPRVATEARGNGGYGEQRYSVAGESLSHRGGDALVWHCSCDNEISQDCP